MRKEYDFSKAKRASEVPHLAKLQAEIAEIAETGKARITIYLDTDILDVFRERAKSSGKGYQTLINDALRGYIENKEPLTAEILRKILKEELHA